MAIGSGWVEGSWVDAAWVVGAWAGASSISAALSGKVIFAESEVIAGGGETILTITGDTWVAAGAAFNAQRQNIIDGFDSAQVEATGWNAEVRDKEVVGAVVRTSDTVVTITWSAAAAYDVTAREDITATVPATALAGSESPVASSTLQVNVVDPASSLNGAILTAMNKPTINQALATKFSQQADETLQDAERRWLDAQTGVSSASINGMWIQYLSGEGYSGTFNDMWLAWWRDGAPE